MSIDHEVEAGPVNWVSIRVNRERTHESTCKRLCFGEPVIFRFLKDLMIFAALIAYSRGERRALLSQSQDDLIRIELATYANDESDGYIYLLGLLELKDANILRDNKLNEAVKVFEEYCNAGLYIITEWLDDNPSNLDGVETLLNEIQEELVANRASDADDEAPISIV